MALMSWATHVLQGLLQRVAQKKFEAKLKKAVTGFVLAIETHGHEGGIASNRSLASCGEEFKRI
jgi:hypothetical protein